MPTVFGKSKGWETAGVAALAGNIAHVNPQIQ
jgi:hypothetical protein